MIKKKQTKMWTIVMSRFIENSGISSIKQKNSARDLKA